MEEESTPMREPAWGAPVGASEIARLLDVKPQTVAQWLQRGLMPERDWTVGGRPAWAWIKIRSWAKETGRAKPELWEEPPEAYLMGRCEGAKVAELLLATPPDRKDSRYHGDPAAWPEPVSSLHGGGGWDREPDDTMDLSSDWRAEYDAGFRDAWRTATTTASAEYGYRTDLQKP